MSGTTSAPDAASPDLEAVYRQYLQQLQSPQPVPLPQGPTPSSHEGRGFLSLLGEALGGGEQYGTTAEREAGGLAALGAMGRSMLANSDYSYQRHSLGSIIGQGMGAAGETLAGRQSMSAAQQAANLDYQKQQQEMQLARIKEAVPLLTALQTLQQQKRVAGMPSSLGSTPASTSISAAGTPEGGGIGAPILARDPNAGTAGQQGNNPGNIMLASGTPLPAGATGAIPASGGRYVAAFPDAATGIAAHSDNLAAYQTAHGINTIRGAVTRWVGDPKADLTTYVADISKAAGVDPDAPVDLTDPKIQRAFFMAQQPHESGKPWLSAADVDKGIALAQARRRGGQPPGAPAVAGAPQTPPAASTAPPAPVVGKGTPLPAGRPTGPPVITDQPPAGSATVAGPPGVTTVGQPLPPSPAVSGDVGAIIGGMTGAGASPTTLAAGPMVPAPQASTQAEVQPQPPPITTQPDQAPPAAGPPTFTYTRHDPPPGMLQGSKLTSEEQSVVQDARNAYQNAIRVAITPEQRQQAEATLQATLDKELTARAGRTDAAGKQLADWYANDFKQQQEQHKIAVDSFYKNQDQQQQFANQLRLEQTKGEQTRLTNKEAVFNQANQKGLETAQTEQANARDIVTQAEGFQTLSDNVGQPGWLQTTKFPGDDRTIAERLQQSGIKLDDTAGVQLLRGGITNLVKTLRAGMPMGSLSDRDLSFVERMGPTEWMDPDTRTAAVSYIVQAYRAKMRFASDVQKEMSRGKNYGDAVDAADAKQKPFVPAVPADLTAHWRDPDPAWAQRRIQWAQENDVRPGTLYHMSDGSIAVMRDPNRKLKTEQR